MKIILTDWNVGQTTTSVNPSYNGSKTEALGLTDILNTSLVNKTALEKVLEKLNEALV